MDEILILLLILIKVRIVNLLYLIYAFLGWFFDNIMFLFFGIIGICFEFLEETLYNITFWFLRNFIDFFNAVIEFLIINFNAVIEFLIIKNLIKFISVILIVVPILLTVALLTLLERKIMATVQRRRGPNIIGFFGLLQPFADGLKLLTKEFNIPARSFDTIVTISPMMSLLFTCSCFSLIPLASSYLFYTTNNISILYIMAISSLNIYSIIMAGWSSKSTYAFLGCLRASAQFISYEVSLTLSIMGIFLISGSFNLVEIAYMQEKSLPNIVILFPIFFLYLIGVLSETNRTPYDLAEAESELVAGYGVEFSAAGFAFFFIAEYASIILYCLLIINLFFSGIANIDFLKLFKNFIFFILNLLFGYEEVKNILDLIESFINFKLKQFNKGSFLFVSNNQDYHTLSSVSLVEFKDHYNAKESSFKVLLKSFHKIRNEYYDFFGSDFLGFNNDMLGVFFLKFFFNIEEPETYKNVLRSFQQVKKDYLAQLGSIDRLLKAVMNDILDCEVRREISLLKETIRDLSSDEMEELYWNKYFKKGFAILGERTTIIDGFFDLIKMILRQEINIPNWYTRLGTEGWQIDHPFFRENYTDSYSIFYEKCLSEYKINEYEKITATLAGSQYTIFYKVRPINKFIYYFFHLLQYIFMSIIYGTLTLFLLNGLILLRATYARYRFDQLMKLNWKNLLILALILDLYIVGIILIS